MNKKLLIILLILVLFCAPLIYSAMPKTESINPCIRAGFYDENYDSIGCGCTTIKGNENPEKGFYYSEYTRSNWYNPRSAPEYCYAIEGVLEGVKPGVFGNIGYLAQCTNDDFTQYSSVYGFEDNEEYKANEECPNSLFISTPFCIDNKCHVCPGENGDGYCQKKLLSLSQDIVNYNFENFQCIKGEYLRKEYECYYCKELKNVGNPEGEIKITFMINRATAFSDQEIEELSSRLLNIEPFKSNSDKFAIRIAVGDYENLKGIILDEKEVKSYIDEVCGGSDIYVYVNDKSFLSSVESFEIASETNNIIMYNPRKGPVFAQLIGASYCDLGPEYPTDNLIHYSDRANIQNTDFVTGFCPKFDGSINPLVPPTIPELNCVKFYTGRIFSYFKSTDRSSIMDGRGSKFNVISCATCLEKITGPGDPIKQCRMWSCEGEVVQQSEESCVF